MSDKLPFKGPAIPKSKIKQSSFMNASPSMKQNSDSSEQTKAQEAQSHDPRTDCSATSTETNWSRPMTHETLAKSVMVKPSLQRMKKVAKLDAITKETDDYKHSHLPEKVKWISKKHDEKRKYEIFKVYGVRKYKPVAIKVCPVKTTLPDEFRVVQETKGDPLEGMPVLPIIPPPFTPGKCYTLERKEIINKLHEEEFMWPQE